MADLLDPLGKGNVREFKRDFIQIIRIARGMDRYFASSREDLGKYMKNYEKLVKLLNKKYKGLFFKVASTAEDLRLRVFFQNDKSVKETFSNASRIMGIKAVGLNSFGEAEVGTSQMVETLDRANDRLYISYYDSESGSSTIFIEYDKKQKMVELIYDMEGIANEKSPEFKLCVFYGLHKGYDKEIDLEEWEAKFGFIEYPTGQEKLDWQNDFLPPITE